MTDRMITRMPPLRTLAAFEAVARNLSFQKAAAELNVTPSAVSQQIKALESHLSATLFQRLNRRILLTEIGELYYGSVASSFAGMADATERIVSHRKPQIMVIRSVPSFAAKWLLPRLPDFIARYPDIDIRLDASNEKVDFGREPIDLDIRIGEGNWQGMHVDPLYRERIVPLAAPSLVRTHRLVSSHDLLNGVRLIHSVKCPVSWDMWLDVNGLPRAVAARGPRFDRAFMAIEAACQGLGVVLDSDRLAEQEIRSNRLTVLFPKAKTFLRQVLWLACPFENLQRPGVSAFRNWLLAHPEIRNHR